MIQHINGIIDAMRTFIPKIDLVYKQDAKIMHLLNKVVRLWCPDFMTRYTTTFGYTIYSNTKPEYLPTSSIATIAHECVHLWHRKHAPILYEIGYVLPQALALLAPLGFLGLLYTPLFALFAFVVFVLPIPSPVRFYTEYHAYAMSMAVRYWMTGKMEMPNLNTFTDSNYYFMWPFTGHLTRLYAKEMLHIENGTFLINKPLHQAVYDYLRVNDLLHKS